MVTMSRHTQGDWYTEENGMFIEVKSKLNKDCVYDICYIEIDRGDEQASRADSALIAAAPDLFRALNGLMKSLKEREGGDRINQDELDQSIYWAECIIKKAGGEL